MHSPGRSKRIAPLVVVLLVLASVGYGIYSTGRNKGYSPDQPIPFSHKLHAGQYNIPCMYCHSGVEKGRAAVVPPTNVCMNCHSQVATDKPNIKKLREYFEKGEQIPWIKVHNLPDYVYFNHKRHIAKGITCETCHGNVKEMGKIRQDTPMTMGWCLECHRGNSAPDHLFTKENAFHQPGLPAETVAQMGLPKKGSQVAPVNCYTCHR